MSSVTKSRISDIDLERDMIFKEWHDDLPLLDRCILACLSRGDSVRETAEKTGLRVREIYRHVNQIRRSYLENFS